MPLSDLFTTTIHTTGVCCDARASETLLLSLERAGIDWPSACRNGTCRACIGTLLQGQVRYQIEWPGLTPEEKQQGKVLPCAAYPTTHVTLQPES